MLYPKIEIAKFQSRRIETIWRSSCLYMYAHIGLCQYGLLTYQYGVSIVSLFISTRRLAMPDFDEGRRQGAHAFGLKINVLLIEIDLYP